MSDKHLNDRELRLKCSLALWDLGFCSSVWHFRSTSLLTHSLCSHSSAKFCYCRPSFISTNPTSDVEQSSWPVSQWLSGYINVKSFVFNWEMWIIFWWWNPECLFFCEPHPFPLHSISCAHLSLRKKVCSSPSSVFHQYERPVMNVSTADINCSGPREARLNSICSCATQTCLCATHFVPFRQCALTSLVSSFYLDLEFSHVLVCSIAT